MAAEGGEKEAAWEWEGGHDDCVTVFVCGGEGECRWVWGILWSS